MNRTTPESTFCWKRISVPKGLPALLEILAKETIREQPKDIPTFLSNLIQDLIAKRDQEGKGEEASSTEASALLDKTLDKHSPATSESHSDPQFEEALAASKIQAGFRGYKTRKALKSRNSKKGGELSLTSLTPFNTNTHPTPKNAENKDDESDEEKQKRLDKMADEEIAAELKTPLETIREESFDKSPQIKSPEALSEVNKLEESESVKNLPNASPQPIIGKLEEICEEEEKVNLQEIHDNLSEEFGNVSLDDAKTESFDLEMEIMEEDLGSSSSIDIRVESDADRELLEKQVNQLLKSENAEIAVEEEDQTSVSQSLAAIDDKALEDIHESEVETMMLEEIENNTTKVNAGESYCESPINQDEKIEKFKEIKEEIVDLGKVVSTNDVESDQSEPVSLSVDFEYKSEDNYLPVISGKGEKAATSTDANLEENNSDLVEKSEINTNDLLNKCDSMAEINSIDVEKPKYDQMSFANTDSISSSATTVHFHKNEDTSQDTSSLSETPKPKPRKPLTETVTLVDETEKPKEHASDEPQPVLRRQKSSPKARGKAVASKYRSGMVVDDGVSMEEMEIQIETEMMAQAATRIQAGFRGYKTRKSMRHSGVSKTEDGDGNKKAKLSTSEDGESPLNETLAASAVNYAMASASADRISALKRDTKPGFMRSRSYPEDEGGAAALDETNASKRESLPDVELDPTYVNIAAIRIQSSFRGYLVRKSLKTKKRGNRQLSHSDSEKASKVKFEVGDPQLTRDFTLDLADPPNSAEEKHDSQQGNELAVSPADRGISPAPSDSEMAAIKIQSAFRGMRDRQKVKQTKKAAVVIQATVRGFLTRRRLMKLRRRSVQRRRSSAKSMISSDAQKLQKANDAATKIQSIYRGYQVRSRIKRSGTDE